MRKRTHARECALKILYQIDITKDETELSIQNFWENQETEESIKDFATQLVNGTMENIDKINSIISAHAENWQISRMAVIDRNILRLAAYELLFLTDIPPKVSINEAVELAKKYGDTDSSKFVNGILDKINKTERKPNGKTG